MLSRLDDLEDARFNDRLYGPVFTLRVLEKMTREFGRRFCCLFCEAIDENESKMKCKIVIKSFDEQSIKLDLLNPGDLVQFQRLFKKQKRIVSTFIAKPNDLNFEMLFTNESTMTILKQEKLVKNVDNS
uniref:Uncharacterized protein n=1 Tax=Panagrolaimus sp. JU765 TaxID=591449 RepID=A0AC34QCP3_9BILA